MNAPQLRKRAAQLLIEAAIYVAFAELLEQAAGRGRSKPQRKRKAKVTR